MSSLDVRIFMVTIFLSVVLLGVSVTEFLCCFKVIQDVASLAEWKFLLYYLLSEQFPSITITCFFNTANVAEDEEISSEVDDIYDSKNNNNKDRKKKQRSRSGDN